jgi:hypothetical protein
MDPLALGFVALGFIVLGFIVLGFVVLGLATLEAMTLGLIDPALDGTPYAFAAAVLCGRAAVLAL